MAIKVIMPKQGLQMTEGKIIAWLAPEGSTVKKGQALFEIETDKVTITIDSPADGTLLKVIRGEGESVPVAETVALIGEPGENIESIAGSAGTARAPAQLPAAAAVEIGGRGARKSSSTYATPRARMRAAEMRIEVDGLAGSARMASSSNVTCFLTKTTEAVPVARPWDP